MKKIILITLFLCQHLNAKDFQTNALNVKNAPVWVKQSKIEKATDKIQDKLDWSIRRVNLYFYSTPEAFDSAQNLGDKALAVTSIKNNEAAVHLGPRVNKDNYEQTLAHELVHVIVFQKHKNSIPKWLEEGLANHLSKMIKLDYKWLAKQSFPERKEDLAHPFKGSPELIVSKYAASQALAEMLDKKCDLLNLIRISLERNLEDYISRTCEIKDVMVEYKKWVLKKAI